MSGESEIQLLGLWASPFVIRVGIALNLKGLSYEYIEQDLANKSELLLKSNPVHKKVPVLIHKGKPICESQIIVQYIDEHWAGTGPSILPSDPYDRAIARFWASYVDDKLFPAWIGILKAKTEEEKTEAIKQTISCLEVLEDAFKKCSKGKDFFCGNMIGYVDVVLGSNLGWFKALHKMIGITFFDEAKMPLLSTWVKRFASIDAAKKLIPDVERLMEFAKMLQARWSAAETK